MRLVLTRQTVERGWADHCQATDHYAITSTGRTHNKHTDQERMLPHPFIYFFAPATWTVSRLAVHKVNRFKCCVTVWKENKGQLEKKFNFRQILLRMSLRKCSPLRLTRLTKAVVLVIYK